MTHELAEIPVLSISLPAWVTRLIGSSCIYPTLEAQMRLAITLARENVLNSSGGPFGAAVFEQGSDTRECRCEQRGATPQRHPSR